MDKKPSILIVDDDALLQKTLSDILTARGYKAQAVGSGPAALEAVQARPPAVALIDLRLQGMSGLDLLREIKQIEPDTQCIVVTGHASQSSAIDAINLGAYSYVPKPYNMDQLLLAVQRAVETRENQMALRESEEQQRTIVEHMADGILIHDLDGRIVEANQRFCRMVAYDREQLLSMVIADLDPDATTRDDRARFWTSLAANESAVIETIHRRQDGSLYACEVNLVPVMMKGQKCILGSVRDITERKQIEARLLEAQRMEAVGQLAAGIAHDFNNLLTSINGFAELMQMQLPDDDVMQQPLGSIRRSGERAAELVSQLLAFGRKQIIQPRPLDLNQVLIDMEPPLRSELEDTIELQISPCPGLWPIEADPRQIKGLINSLVNNARDAMPEGGLLRIETANAVLAEADIAIHPEAQAGDYVRLTVRDSGLGLNEEAQARVFEPFFVRTRRVADGVGLRMASVFGIVKQNQGHIWVDSQPGQGTAFRIFLRRYQPGEAPRI